MPRHSRIDNEAFIRFFQRFQPVIDFVVDFGMRFHIFVQLVRGHAVLRSDGALYRSRIIKFQIFARGKNFSDRAFSAA